MLPSLSDFHATRQSFIEEAVETALDAAWADGLALSFTENGMKEPTRWGQKIEDEAEEEAAEIFDEVLKSYLTQAASFNAESDYADEIGHAMASVDDGSLTDAESEALNLIATTHEAFLKTKCQAEETPQTQPQAKPLTPTQRALKTTPHNEILTTTHAATFHENPIRALTKTKTKLITQTITHNEKRSLAQFLLKAPLEFADHSTTDLLNKTDQENFTQILNTLRTLAAL